MSDRESGDTNLLLGAIVKAGQAWKEGLGKIEDQNDELRDRLTKVETKLAGMEKISYAVLLAIILAVVGKLMNLI